MILGTVIFALFLLSFVYFILDGIIAPSEQLLLRVALHNTAKEIDDLAKDHSLLKPAAAQVMKGAAYGLIKGMPRYNLCNLARIIHKRENDSKFKQASRERVQLLDSCDSAEVKLVRLKLVNLGDKVLITNSISWGVYILPIALCMVMFGKMQKAVKALITTPAVNFERSSKFAAC